MTFQEKVDQLIEELRCTRAEAANALLSRNERIEMAREFIEIARDLKQGKGPKIMMSDSQLYPKWGAYLAKQNG